MQDYKGGQPLKIDLFMSYIMIKTLLTLIERIVIIVKQYYNSSMQNELNSVFSDSDTQIKDYVKQLDDQLYKELEYFDSDGYNHLERDISQIYKYANSDIQQSTDNTLDIMPSINIMPRKPVNQLVKKNNESTHEILPNVSPEEYYITPEQTIKPEDELDIIVDKANDYTKFNQVDQSDIHVDIQMDIQANQTDIQVDIQPDQPDNTCIPNDSLKALDELTDILSKPLTGRAKKYEASIQFRHRKPRIDINPDNEAIFTRELLERPMDLRFQVMSQESIDIRCQFLISRMDVVLAKNFVYDARYVQLYYDNPICFYYTNWTHGAIYRVFAYGYIDDVPFAHVYSLEGQRKETHRIKVKHLVKLHSWSSEHMQRILRYSQPAFFLDPLSIYESLINH